MKKSNLVVATVMAAIFAITFAFTGTLRAAEEGPVAVEYWGTEGIEFVPIISFNKIVLTLSYPNGQVASKTFYDNPRFNINESWGPKFTDGPYTFELRALLKVDPKEEWRLKEYEGIYTTEPVVQNGFFYIERGSVIQPEEEKQERQIAPSTEGSSPSGTSSNEDLSSTKDVCYADDVIIDGSLCVGFDCTCNYSFGFDTIVLKENNLRIFFDDTSTAASFPRNDWRIVINDSANGGASYFGVEDASASRRVFTLEAGAPSHSLYVDDGGRVGFGTSTPSLELHVKDGDTPSLRLEQDGSSGFAPQTWDVAGNETNFFIRDATNGSTLPFRIRPGAPSSSIFIDPEGDVGMGTSSPTAGYSLHLYRSGADSVFVAERASGAAAYMTGSSSYAFFGSVNSQPLRIVVDGSYKMQVNSDGTLDMSDGGSYNGTWNPASSREFKENIQDLSADEALKAFEDLSPVKYNYKKHKDEARLGFIAEDVPELVAMNGRKNLSTMDIVALLTKVVKEQQKVNKSQQDTISQLQERIAKMEKSQKEK